MVIVDALPVPVRGRGLAVDGESEGFVLDDDGVGRRGLPPFRGPDGQPVRVFEPERTVIEALHVESALVHQPVMRRAQQDEVVEGGLAAVGPVPDVMAVEPVSPRGSRESGIRGRGLQVHGVRMEGCCGCASRR